MARRQILALSDSASLFVPSWQPPLYLNTLLEMAGCEAPRILYIGAAKGDNPQRIAEIYSLTAGTRCRARVLSFFDMLSDNTTDFFADTDIVYIDGGSTRNLLAILREWDAVDALRSAYERGVIIAGASAGANIFFEQCMTDSVKTDIRPISGLGILRGSICVHHDAREDRRVKFAKFLNAEGAAFPAYALEDGVALHFVDEEFVRAFSLNSDTNSWRIDSAGCKEEMINVSILGGIGGRN